ncbi:hypothetical protein [Methylosinus sp. PW1]|uniref:hypothetical protein n=1 Tax=Methylosinus sp. PW1 TaxID=107636 RepID=UPI0005658ECF|nr:hypothetical protein [Methylosinus sp. PW1]
MQYLDDRVFDDERLTGLYITIEDVLDEGLNVNATRLVQRRNALVEEYNQAFDYLAERFKARDHFQIFVLNWEADNRIYCGHAWSFATSPQERGACEASVNLYDRIQAYREWSRLRQEAVSAARSRHTGLDITVVPEINNVSMFAQQCNPAKACDHYKTALEILSAGGTLPLCSYSAYEALKSPLFSQIIQRLLTVCDRVIFGEVGFKLTDVPAEKFSKFAGQIQPFLPRIESVVIWNSFEEESNRERGYGLFSGDGAPLNFRNLPQGLGPE